MAEVVTYAGKVNAKSKLFLTKNFFYFFFSFFFHWLLPKVDHLAKNCPLKRKPGDSKKQEKNEKAEQKDKLGQSTKNENNDNDNDNHDNNNYDNDNDDNDKDSEEGNEGVVENERSGRELGPDDDDPDLIASIEKEKDANKWGHMKEKRNQFKKPQPRRKFANNRRK